MKKTNKDVPIQAWVEPSTHDALVKLAVMEDRTLKSFIRKELVRIARRFKKM